MELIDKVKDILTKVLKSPSFDIHYDDHRNIIGYVSDEYFIQKGDKESQEFIWKSLRDSLGNEELIKISSIFHESPQEKVNRLTISENSSKSSSRYWQHTTPDQTKYWLFLDVFKFEMGYKCFYLIINEKERLKKVLTYVYTNAVIQFMELEPYEIDKELYNTVFDNAESEIKLHLMKRHEKLTKQGLWGKANLFDYVFKDFRLNPIQKHQLIFSDREISMIISGIRNLDDFPVKKEIEAITLHQPIKETKK